MIYKVTLEWIARRRRMARWAPVLLVAFAVGILCLSLLPRVDWSKAQDRHAAVVVTLVVVLGFGLGGLVGKFSFNNAMHNWETFEIELSPNELIRRLRGQEVRISRANVTSIREFRGRGFVVTDNLGWRIFVPKMVNDYQGFREEILKWGNVR